MYATPTERVAIQREREAYTRILVDELSGCVSTTVVGSLSLVLFCMFDSRVYSLFGSMLLSHKVAKYKQHFTLPQIHVHGAIVFRVV